MRRKVVFVVTLVALMSIGFAPKSDEGFRPEMLASNLDLVSSVLIKRSAAPWYLNPALWIGFLATLVALGGSAVLE